MLTTLVACGLVSIHPTSFRLSGIVKFVNSLKEKNPTLLNSLVFTKCKANIEHGTRLENMSWRLWYRETANHHEVNKDYFSFVPPRNDRLHYIGSSEPSPALSASSTLTTSSSRSTRQFSPVSFIRFISSLSPDHNLKDLLKEEEQPKGLKMETTGINLKTELEAVSSTSSLTHHRDLEKKDKGRDKGEHEILNANTTYQEILPPVGLITTTPADNPVVVVEPDTSRNNYSACSKIFYIKSDDENEAYQQPDKKLPRKSFRLPPPVTAIAPRNNNIAGSVSSLGSITDYDSDFDDDDDEDDDDDDSLFLANELRTVDSSFHKKSPSLKHQRSLLSTMLSHTAVESQTKPRPIPPPSTATIRQSPDPSMTKELSESLRRNVLWEQSQKRLCYFRRRAATTHPPPKSDDHPSLTDDEFQGW